MQSSIPKQYLSLGGKPILAQTLQVFEDCSAIVVVHCGVRRLFTRRLMPQSIETAQKNGAAVVAVLSRDTVKRAALGKKIQTLPREEIWLAQTPQTFQFPLLMKAYQKAHQDDILATDDASLVERLGHPVTLVTGDYSNIKITTPEDLALAETLLSRVKRGK